MGAKLSVEEVLSNLEERAVFHRDQEAFHAQREVHHREQRTLHAAELEKVEQSLQAFRAVAPTAVELARPVAPKSAPPPPTPTAGPPLPPPGRNFVGGLLRLTVQSADLPEPFGPKALAAEANRRFRDHLPEPIDKRTASDSLRQMLAEGRVQLVRKGRAVHEALYRRKTRKGEP